MTHLLLEPFQISTVHLTYRESSVIKPLLSVAKLGIRFTCGRKWPVKSRLSHGLHIAHVKIKSQLPSDDFHRRGLSSFFFGMFNSKRKTSPHIKVERRYSGKFIHKAYTTFEFQIEDNIQIFNIMKWHPDCSDMMWQSVISITGPFLNTKNANKIVYFCWHSPLRLSAA